MENNNFKEGIKDGIPIFLGYLAVSFAFGISAVGMGLTVWEAVMVSVLNLTSAGQFAGVPIMVGGGSLAELATSQLIINLRYSLMSVSLSQKLSPKVKLRERMLIAYANTDEIFAVASAKGVKLGSRYMFGLMILPVLGWTLGTLLGAAAGNILPEMALVSLGIAIYGMFIAIVMPFAKKSAKDALCVLSAIGLSVAFYFVPLLNRVPSGFSVIIVAVAVSLAFALVAPVEEEKGGER